MDGIKNVIIYILLCLVIALALVNKDLRERNRLLVRGIREVYMNNLHHIPGYIRPSKIIRELELKRLTGRR